MIMRAARTDTSLGRWDNEGGAPKSHRRSQNERSPPARPATSALYYFNSRSAHALLDDPEGSTLPDLKAALHEALTLASQSLAEGYHKGEDRRGWRVEIMDRANQHLLTVAFREVGLCKWPRRGKRD
jgi:uncharacterized protein DUF6894